MADTKKNEEVVKKETPTTSSPKETTAVEGGKKKSKTIWYIVGGIILLLILIPVIGFFVVRGIIKKGVDTYEDTVIEYEQDMEEEETEITGEEGEEEGEDEDSAIYKKPTEETVDGELENADKVNARFPEDLPLSGGIVTASSYSSDYSTDVKIDVDSTVEEVLDWYEGEFEELEWIITERSSSEAADGWVSGKVGAETEDGERRVRVAVQTNPFQDFTSVTITEYFY